VERRFPATIPRCSRRLPRADQSQTGRHRDDARSAERIRPEGQGAVTARLSLRAKRRQGPRPVTSSPVCGPRLAELRRCIKSAAIWGYTGHQNNVASRQPVAHAVHLEQSEPHRTQMVGGRAMLAREPRQKPLCRDTGRPSENCMRSPRRFSIGKAEFLSGPIGPALSTPAPSSGLTFQDIDGGTGLVFSVASPSRTIYFGAGRCSWYPQKQRHSLNAGIGQILQPISFLKRGRRAGARRRNISFLHDRHRRAHRPPRAHEREERARTFQKAWIASAFVKNRCWDPRGDFRTKPSTERRSFRSYLDEVAQSYDSIIDPADRLGKPNNRVFSAR